MTLPDDLSTLPFEELLNLWKNLVPHVEGLPDDPVPRCGWYCLSTTSLYNLFGKSDPFLVCCMAHDVEYALKRKPRKQVDWELYTCMKFIAGFNPLLHVAALAYYAVVKTAGGLFW